MVNWGILATGSIAHQFVQGLKLLDDVSLVAVGSRSLMKASEFAMNYGIRKAYGSYEELAADTEVDIVYIATPHPFHKECALLCLKAGKAVLCEKPFCMNAEEASEVILLAKEKKLFLMEAMWTRAIPAILKVRDWLEKDMIGDVRCLKADFGFRAPWEPEGRLLNPHLGGGALLDVGIYPVSFASMVFRKQPSRIESIVTIGPTGVDEQSGLLFGYDDGSIASLTSAVRTGLVNDAWIFGTEGMIHIPDFFCAKEARIVREGKIVEQFGPEFEGTGYQYEAKEVIRCLKNNETESPMLPLDETLSILKTMDKIRQQWGLKYPME